MIATPFRGEFFVCTSSGTTGRPGLFVYDRGAIDIYRAITFARIGRAWFGAVDWWRMAQRGFRWAAVLGTGGHYNGAGWIELERQRDAWRSRKFRVFSVQQPLAELVAALNAFDPAMLTGYPSALELLAEEQAAGRLKLRPVLPECGGETLSQDAGARMAAAFACRVPRKLGRWWKKAELFPSWRWLGFASNTSRHFELHQHQWLKTRRL
jgi:phenylacetate-coenzyme A ligase PaaK-like adenylate-forming protein